MSASGDRVEEDLKITIADPTNMDEAAKTVGKMKKLVLEKEDLKKRFLAAGISPFQQSPYGPISNLPIDRKVQALQNLYMGLPPTGKLHPRDTIDEENMRRLAAGLPPVRTAYSTSANIPTSSRIMRSSGLIAGIPATTPPTGLDKLTQHIKKSLLGEVESKASEFFSFVRNPSTFIGGKLMSLLKVAGPLAAIGVGYEVAQQVFELVKAQFGDGGLFDVRKITLNAVKVFGQLDVMSRISSGQVFFDGSAGQKLRQRSPEYSNTRLLRDGHRRYNQMNYGV